MSHAAIEWAIGSQWSGIRRDVLRFLAMWTISISDAGLVYARPRIDPLTGRHLCSLLRRLSVVWDREFPRLIAIDLTGVRVRPLQRESVWRQLRRFADRVGARLIDGALCEENPDFVLILRVDPGVDTEVCRSVD